MQSTASIGGGIADDAMNHADGKGWNLVEIPKIILAEEILRIYYRDHRPRQLNRKELTVAFIEEILRYEAHDLSVGGIGFCLSEWGSIDWDFVAFPNRLAHATILEVHKRACDTCKEISSFTLNAELIAMVMDLQEDVRIDELLKEDLA